MVGMKFWAWVLSQILRSKALKTSRVNSNHLLRRESNLPTSKIEPVRYFSVRLLDIPVRTNQILHIQDHCCNVAGSGGGFVVLSRVGIHHDLIIKSAVRAVNVAEVLDL